ncbi:ABC transporter ATP-binding protein [Mycolicibacterium fallax]|uniref:ABC transporter ATP-binding protein n=1 Tax=Mycolicibacterium fallax TaxID=1793 RepID=A0A1X1RD50_MYCFA|nr:ATP-binding cassette domain-containing protein [Mycolicibacterium fallax]ORV03151.1 ABC transporter ATP-binding protein [Mycolicibacterium fallax]BBY98848.1 ABC transporter ATP-binding protein [Mycolicibacterium fallax]
MIELRGLTKRYGATAAVDDLTATVAPGVVTGFLGPNGAGKSTTMRLILGLDRPTAGTATIDGRAYRSLRRPLHQVGALLDARALAPSRSVRAHLRWIAAANGIARSRVEAVLGQVGLDGVADRRAGTLSLGMCQRLGIAAALLGDPPVLLFDEPVNGLDPEGIRWVRTLMRELAGQGRTVLVSSHLLAEMADTADALLVIGRGRLVAATSVADFVAGAAGAAVRVRSPQRDRLRAALTEAGIGVADEGDALLVTGADTDTVGELAAARGLVLHELSARAPSLEQAYLQVTDAVTDYRSGAS